MVKEQALAQTLKAFSNPTRLSVFDMLMEGVQCNCEIAERLGLSLSLISHHLRILRQVGLVQSERDSEDARWVYYSVNQRALAELIQAVDHLLDVDRIQPRVPSCGPKKCDQ
ncbi:MAG: winged helix-turn-helix transcriptional regulator [Chloroflexi bacterium]|nr:winged helix-turn-helix transcriptional regulator [Chloroflexota bacterium]